MSLIATRKPLYGNVVKHEYAREHGFCREAVTVNVAGGVELSVGSVLGVVAGKYVPRNPAGTDGSEVAAAIVAENKTVGDAVDVSVAVLVRGPSIVAKQGLVFDVAHNAGEIDTAVAEIESLGIVVREQV